MQSTSPQFFLKKKTEIWIFRILIFIHLLPVWIVPFVPTQDGPTHLENAVILTNYHNPGNERVRTYYELNTADPSNWLIQLILAGFTLIFPPFTAIKVLISIYIILLPLSFRYCLSHLNPEQSPLLWLIFPFIYNYVLHMGFFGFCFSLILFFYTLGFWMKVKDQHNVRTGIMLSLLFIITYLFHIVSLVMVLAALILLSFLFYFSDRRRHMNARDRLKTNLQFLWLTSIPVLVFLCQYYLQHGSTVSYESTSSDRLIQLAALTSLYSFVRSELILSALLALLIFLLSLFQLTKMRRGRTWREKDMFVILVLFYTVVYFLTPDKITSGSVINARLLLYPYFILLLWLGSFRWHRIIQAFLFSLIIIISTLQLAIIVHNYRQSNDAIRTYISVADLLEPDHILLPLSFYDNRSQQPGKIPRFRINPFMHLSSYLVIESGVIQLGNYQAWYGCFPVQYRSQMDPMKNLAVNGQLEDIPPVINLQLYLQKTDRTIDYLLLWGYDAKQWPGGKKSSQIQDLFQQIRQYFELMYESSPDKTVRLYQAATRNPYYKKNDRLSESLNTIKQQN